MNKKVRYVMEEMESKVSDTMQKGQKVDSGMVGDALDPTTLLRYSLVSCAICVAMLDLSMILCLNRCP